MLRSWRCTAVVWHQIGIFRNAFACQIAIPIFYAMPILMLAEIDKVTLPSFRLGVIDHGPLIFDLSIFCELVC